MAISTNMAGNEDKVSDDTGTTSFTPNRDYDIDITFGRVVAKNLEAGVILSSNTYTEDSGTSFTSTYRSNSASIGPYGRYYLFVQEVGAGGMVPWVQGAILVGNHKEGMSGNDPAVPASRGDAGIFTTAISIGASHFLSENVSIEYELTRRFTDITEWMGTDTGLSPYPSGYAEEEESTYLTVGLSIIF